MKSRRKALGLISRHDPGATLAKCKLSHPRGVLVLIRRTCADDESIVALCDSGIKTLTSIIGDGFKP